MYKFNLLYSSLEQRRDRLDDWRLWVSGKKSVSMSKAQGKWTGILLRKTCRLVRWVSCFLSQSHDFVYSHCPSPLCYASIHNDRQSPSISYDIGPSKGYRGAHPRRILRDFLDVLCGIYTATRIMSTHTRENWEWKGHSTNRRLAQKKIRVGDHCAKEVTTTCRCARQSFFFFFAP